jgi:TonB family protein
MRQSFLAHLLVVVAVYGGSLWWLNRPRVLIQDATKTTTIIHYQLSEYLPEVNPHRERDEPPAREHAQKADPEYSAQRILSLHPDHNSTQQTIIQPDLTLLQRDLPLPNLAAWSALQLPGAAPVATRHPLMDLPPSAAPVVAPPQPTLERNASRLVFPEATQPEVVAPSTPVAHSALQILAMKGPVVIAPAQDAAMRDPSRLQLPAQAPPQIAAPASDIASGHVLATFPSGRPAIVPPAQNAAQHRLNALELPAEGSKVVPPVQPIASGGGQAEIKEIGQMLLLNARPVAPKGPVVVPEGNRNGEFAAGPEGRTGASATPETSSGDASTARHPGKDNMKAGGVPANVYVAAPPVKIGGGAVVAAPVQPPGPTARASVPDYGESSSPESIENRVFGGRRRYLLRLNMPNLTSAMGSWTIRFAELKADAASGQGDISSPEPIRKVDPVYPAALLHDRVEGVVVLHAIIHSDGTVGDVRVLEGFNEELDANARNALEQWRFLPGLRNGVPVDVEAVIRVPFRVPRRGF